MHSDVTANHIGGGLGTHMLGNLPAAHHPQYALLLALCCSFVI